MIIEISKLIELNKKHIELKKKLDNITTDILAMGDGLLEGDNCNLLVKDGKIEIVPKPGLSNSGD
jgi:hypothetical protein